MIAKRPIYILIGLFAIGVRAWTIAIYIVWDLSAEGQLCAAYKTESGVLIRATISMRPERKERPATNIADL